MSYSIYILRTNDIEVCCTRSCDDSLWWIYITYSWWSGCVPQRISESLRNNSLLQPKSFHYPIYNCFSSQRDQEWYQPLSLKSTVHISPKKAGGKKGGLLWNVKIKKENEITQSHTYTHIPSTFRYFTLLSMSWRCSFTTGLFAISLNNLSCMCLHIHAW